MEKLPEVESAKALMNEAVSWSTMKWLGEKKHVRKTADEANAALDQLSQSVKDLWPENLRSAYDSLAAPAKASPRGQQASPKHPVDSDALRKAQSIKEADDEAYCARMDTEKTFDDAERKLSTAIAREGCRKAILSWELQEQAIRKAEAILRSK